MNAFVFKYRSPFEHHCGNLRQLQRVSCTTAVNYAVEIEFNRFHIRTIKMISGVVYKKLLSPNRLL